MDFLSADSLPWVAGVLTRLRAARGAGRLPPALLLTSPVGLGAEQLASWIAALALCESQSGAPCGVCPSCVLLRADNHPDTHIVRLLEDAQQIKVDQIRELIGTLSLSSYRGGRKVAIIEDAEAMNVNGANAFLKTLEEPAGDTMLILVAKPSHRLPATVASRCQRLRPARTAEGGSARVARGARPTRLLVGCGAVARRWRTAPRPGSASESITMLDRDMREALKRLAADSVDITLLADAWAKSDWPAEARVA